MRFFRSVFFILIIIHIFVNTSFSESNLSETGKTGMSFLNMAPSSKISSLGGAAFALMTGASSLWSNPSLIAFHDERSAQFTHSEWIVGINQEFVAFSTKMDYGSLGLGVQLLDSGDIEGRSSYMEHIGPYSINYVAFSISYAGMLTDWIALGVTYKKLFQKVFQETAGGNAFDVGVTLKTPIEGFSLAAAGRNYGRMSKLKNERTELPSNFGFGCVYNNVAPGIERSYSVLADIIIPKYGDTGVRLGMEIEAVQYFTLRIGYRSDSDFEDFIYGVGYSWEIVSADFSYSPMNDISEDAMRFTLSFTGF